MKKPNLELLVSDFQSARGILLLALFYNKVKPVADRHDWEVEWGMGGAFFTNRSGEDKTECKEVRKLTEEVGKYVAEIYPNSNYDPLWDICSSLEGSFYHKDHGLTEKSMKLDTHSKFKILKKT
jgi:hypothetical protein